MPTTETTRTEEAIWARVFGPGRLTLSAEAARSLLEIDFPQQDKERMRELASRARAGALTPGEQQEIDTYGRVGSLLSILKSKARMVLRPAQV